MSAHERPHEVNVVDHEIQNDGNVGAARIEWSEAIALDEARRIDEWERARGWPD